MNELLNIENKILVIRGQQVMLDRDLAELYGVETKVLNQAVKRNIDRVPERFMFQLTNEEFNVLRSQIVTSKLETRGGTAIFTLCIHRAGCSNAGFCTKKSNCYTSKH